MNAPKTILFTLVVSLSTFLAVCLSSGQQVSPPAAGDQDTQWLKQQLQPNKKFNGAQTSKRTDVDRFEKLLLQTIKTLPSNSPPQNDATQKSILKPTQEQTRQELQTQWKRLNWDLKQSPLNQFWVISESTGHRYGRGTYALRTNAQSSIALQAPHRFSDLLTGSIAIKLFSEHSFSAIALNSIHRNKIDLAHTKLHYINAFTAAVLKSNNQSAILQIHGFTNKGKTGAAKFTKLILSDTTKFPGRSARQTALELKTTFGPDHSRLFPVEIRQLGGTTNRQSELAHAMGCPNFLHVEFNYKFRTELNSNASTRDEFFASIVRGLDQ